MLRLTFSPTHVRSQFRRHDAVTVVALGAVGGYLALVGHAFAAWPYEHWMVLFLLPVLYATGALGTWVIVRRDREPLYLILLAGLAVKLAATFARYFVTFSVYGYGDATRYDRVGTRIANDYWDGRLTTLDVLTMRQGTGFIEDLTGLIYALIGPSRLGGFLVYSFFGFWGMMLFYRAAILAVPGLAQRRYALLVFFMPAIAFWPSSIGKEAVMMLALGLSAYGAARMLSWQRGGPPVLLAGLGLAYMVRPHLSFVVVASLAIGWLARRPPASSGRFSFGPVGRLVGVGLLALGASFILGETIDRFLPVTESTSATDSNPERSVSDLLDRAESGTASGGSEVERQSPNSPLDYPQAVWSVLFRPTLLEAQSAGTAIAAIETAAVLGLLVVSWARLKNVPRLLLDAPYVTFALMYAAIFTFAWSSFANLGALVRQRVQVWPIVLVFLALPAAEQRRHTQHKRNRGPTNASMADTVLQHSVSTPG